jgi:hypothetical protein
MPSGKLDKIIRLQKKHSGRLERCTSGPEKINFGMKPWDPKAMVPVDAHETWLRSQAQSILGRPVTKAEAEELFERIDINTRQPKQSEQALSPWQKFVRFIN